MDANNALNLERTSLERINRYYKCICREKKNHFPTIVNVINTKKQKLLLG